MVLEPALELLAATPSKLNAAPATLLWHLVKTLAPAGSHASLTDIAQELGLSRVQINAAMKLLLQLGLIIRGPKDGRLHQYRLNDAYFHVL